MITKLGATQLDDEDLDVLRKKVRSGLVSPTFKLRSAMRDYYKDNDLGSVQTSGDKQDRLNKLEKYIRAAETAPGFLRTSLYHTVRALPYMAGAHVLYRTPPYIPYKIADSVVNGLMVAYGIEPKMREYRLKRAKELKRKLYTQLKSDKTEE